MIGIGIIGCGYWGPNHIRNFQSNKRSQVLAFTDTNEERLKKSTEMFPDIDPIPSVDQLLDRKDITAVVVATPTATHYNIVKKCLTRDKDVLCEKPLTLHIHESEELAALAQKRNRILMVGHTFLYNDGIKALKEYIKQGEIGTPQYIHLRRTNLGPIRNDVNVVYDLASHDIYIANYLLDAEPARVTAHGGTYLQPGLEDVAFITLEYPDNRLANIHVSWLDPKKDRMITIIGDKKMIVWDDLSVETIKIYDKSVQVGTKDYGSFGDFQLILKEGDVVLPIIWMRERRAYHRVQFWVGM